MPTNKIPTTTYLDKTERDAVDKAAASRKLSVANYLREKLGFKPLKLGAPSKPVNRRTARVE